MAFSRVRQRMEDTPADDCEDISKPSAGSNGFIGGARALHSTGRWSIWQVLIFRPIDPGLAIFAFADVYLQNLDAHRLSLGPVNKHSKYEGLSKWQLERLSGS